MILAPILYNMGWYLYNTTQLHWVCWFSWLFRTLYCD